MLVQNKHLTTCLERVMISRGAHLQDEDYKSAVATSMGYSGDFAAAYRADKHEFLLVKRKVRPCICGGIPSVRDCQEFAWPRR